MKIGPISMIPYTGAFNVRHQKTEAVPGEADNTSVMGGMEPGEVPATLLYVHKRPTTIDLWA